MKKFLILSFFTFCAASSLGVSRVGGGKISSSESLFELQMAAPFLGLEEYKDAVIAIGPKGFSSTQLISQFIQVREYSSRFHNLAKGDRQDTKNFFTGQQWDVFTKVPDCIEAYSYTNDTATSITMTWGQGKGVILEGPATPTVRQAMETTVQSLTLLPGACSWK